MLMAFVNVTPRPSSEERREPDVIRGDFDEK